MVWASTVPIKVDINDLIDEDSEIEYNSIAAKVMAEHNIPNSDLHGYVEQSLQDKKHPDPFSYARMVPLHQWIVDTIVNQLELADGK